MDNRLTLRRLGIDTASDSVVYMRRDCPVCRAEGFTAHTRLDVTADGRTITATLNLVSGDLLAPGEAGLSEKAWTRLGAGDGDPVVVGYSSPVDSMGHVRAKIFGRRFQPADVMAILTDIVGGRYSDIQLSSFITACSALPLDTDEIAALTAAMVDTGEKVTWPWPTIADKHCVGGLPGNRTTPIVVAITAACGLVIPKTSSRAITSPAGTADTMETLAPVDLSVAQMRKVVEQEGGCVIWGGSVDLSPADDLMIRVERALDLDSQGQLIASVLSKKIAAGSTHLVIDIPVGETAKIRSQAEATALSNAMSEVAHRFGLHMRVLTSDGSQPVGRGIGPALEAHDVLSVLQNETDAPQDLRLRALTLAGALIELAGKAAEGSGLAMAQETLSSGRAWAKFQAICAAQGGMREPPAARFREPVLAQTGGRVLSIDNRKLAKTARFAGAPEVKAAGLELHVKTGESVEAGQPLFTLHADAKGELGYAMDFVSSHGPIMRIGA
ncbi:thymidine phosphorylase [Zhengella mangrovi]|uniref:Putative thymidine phosphorylase n=1 Tax=Zhengella mangrovi TaxID=1982044 RepID=A0A2G1QNE7_9HYPH|nr:thymidine phosphorylase family protein [Zhengella mangrovi]PHP66994.1 thymidine phosphorylase [Zhengella mangrovi]